MKRTSSAPAADAAVVDQAAPAAGDGSAATPRLRARQVGSKAMKQLADAHREAGEEKLVRDSFSMPKDDYALIDLLKKRAAAAGRPTRKNELLRAGLHALVESGRVELRNALDRLPAVRKKKREGS